MDWSRRRARPRARLSADSPFPALAQIKVRDLSRCSVSVMPAEYGSWQEARADLVLEAKKPLKAQMQSEMAAAASDDDAADIRAAFEQRERALEHEIGKPALLTIVLVALAHTLT